MNSHYKKQMISAVIALGAASARADGMQGPIFLFGTSGRESEVTRYEATLLATAEEGEPAHSHGEHANPDPAGAEGDEPSHGHGDHSGAPPASHHGEAEEGEHTHGHGGHANPDPAGAEGDEPSHGHGDHSGVPPASHHGEAEQGGHAHGHGSHEGLSWKWSDWNMTFHGGLKGLATEQGGPRGDSRIFLSGDLGLGATRQVGPGTLTFTAMLTPDPLMGPSGYPLLFQTGETADGKTPLVDFQHPHDLFMELSAAYTLPVSENTSVRGYFGWPGSPALGPDAPDHRFSGVNIPDVPISHHWMDSTHISFGVATLGVTWRNWTLEGSVFNAREPDHARFNIESHPWRSQSIRLTYKPNENWSMQVSHGFLESPRQLFPDSDTDRTTASITYHVKKSAYEWETLFAWGRNANTSAVSPFPDRGNTLDAFMLESTVILQNKHALFTRIERVDKDDLFFADNDPLRGKTFTVNKFELGYHYTFAKTGRIHWGVGVSGSIYAIPHELEERYTDNPVGAFVFISAKIK